MRDDFHSQAWAENHRQVSNAIHKLAGGVVDAFDKLNAYQFEAPWRARPAERSTACKPSA